MARRTVTRKKVKSKLSPDETFAIVKDFVGGTTDYKELAEKYNTNTSNISQAISRVWASLTNLKETKILSIHVNNHNSNRNNPSPSRGYLSLKAIQESKDINKKFLTLLSDDNDPYLTDNELLFSQILVTTGNPLTAIEESGLATGLMKKAGENATDTLRYTTACRLRAEYLRTKPNILSYITSLREEKVQPLIDSIDKEFIQSELLQELSAIKEDVKMPSATRHTLIAKTIENLGRTVGAFSDKIQIEELSPSDALDYLESLDSANPPSKELMRLD